MSKRPVKPPDMPWVSAYLVVRDADAAIAFYEKAFGFERKAAMPGPDGKTKHAEMRWRDAVIMFGPEGEDGRRAPVNEGTRPPIGLYVYCDDVDALFQRATAAGAKTDRAPETMFWGDRTCSVIDPDGYAWGFATNVADFDPSKAPQG